MTVVVVGGGWSGLAAAITLSQHKIPVHLIESAKQLGGRARNVTWQDKTLDNGQHLMVGAYHDMLKLMALIGIDLDRAFSRTAIDVSIYDTEYPPLHISANSLLPWPLSLAWNLWRSADLNAVIQLSRLQSDIKTRLKNPDISVQDWLSQTKQSPRLIKQLWEPLCLAMLNTPIDIASSHLLAHALNDSLGQDKASADLLIPQQALGTLFPTPAGHFIEQHGGKISLQTRVKELIIDDNKIQGLMTQHGDKINTEHLILATSPAQNAELLQQEKPPELPICTVYLQYDQNIRLPQAMMGLSGTTSQWVFDRSQQHAGLLAVVISGPGPHETMDKDSLIKRVSNELHQLLPSLPKHANDAFIIREKRATFASTTAYQKQRPSTQTSTQGLWLAGDAVNNNYPATLEGAIRNGIRAAEAIIAVRG